MTNNQPAESNFQVGLGVAIAAFIAFIMAGAVYSSYNERRPGYFARVSAYFADMGTWIAQLNWWTKIIIAMVLISLAAYSAYLLYQRHVHAIPLPRSAAVQRELPTLEHQELPTLEVDAK